MAGFCRDRAVLSREKTTRYCGGVADREENANLRKYEDFR
jgi:hypothetical protein